MSPNESACQVLAAQVRALDTARQVLERQSSELARVATMAKAAYFAAEDAAEATRLELAALLGYPESARLYELNDAIDAYVYSQGEEGSKAA